LREDEDLQHFVGHGEPRELRSRERSAAEGREHRRNDRCDEQFDDHEPVAETERRPGQDRQWKEGERESVRGGEHKRDHGYRENHLGNPFGAMADTMAAEGHEHSRRDDQDGGGVRGHDRDDRLDQCTTLQGEHRQSGEHADREGAKENCDEHPPDVCHRSESGCPGRPREERANDPRLTRVGHPEGDRDGEGPAGREIRGEGDEAREQRDGPARPSREQHSDDRGTRGGPPRGRGRARRREEHGRHTEQVGEREDNADDRKPHRVPRTADQGHKVVLRSHASPPALAPV
jgi:hypothetical protein